MFFLICQIAELPKCKKFTPYNKIFKTRKETFSTTRARQNHLSTMEREPCLEHLCKHVAIINNTKNSVSRVMVQEVQRIHLDNSMKNEGLIPMFSNIKVNFNYLS